MRNRDWWKEQDDVGVEDELERAWRRACAWELPDPKFGVDENGERVRLYECAVCRDAGVVVLPKRIKGETDEQLAVLSFGPGVAYHCPECRQACAKYRVGAHKSQVRDDRAEHSQAVVKRLFRWRDLVKQRKPRTDLGDRRRELASATSGIGRSIPRLSETEQNEIAAEERAAKEATE